MTRGRSKRGMPGRAVRDRRDISEKLEESQERLRIALESANIGVWDWNVQTGRVIYISPRTGLPDRMLAAQEVDASHWMATTHPDDIAQARGAVERAVRGESQGFSMRYRMHMPGASGDDWSVVHSRGRVVERGVDGKAIRMLGIYEDITSVVAREEADRLRDAHLARATRLASLSEASSSLAHEINQPLAALTAYLQAALRMLDAPDVRTPDLRRALTRCEQQARRASEILRRMRALYRERQVADEAFDVSSAIDAVFVLLASEAEALGIHLKRKGRSGRIRIMADRIQIEQVFYNLVRNAIDVLRDFPHGTGLVTVSCSRQGGKVRVVIADNGPGIPGNIRPRIFEPFFTTKPGGTGLGLSISRSIMEAHRGRLSLDGRVKRGATFVAELPVAPPGKAGRS